MTVPSPGGKDVKTIYIKVFGYEIWFQAKGTRQFIRNCILANRICAIAEKAENQLLRLQKLAHAIHEDY